MLSVLIDTNIWVSAFLTPHGFPYQILTALNNNQFQHILSEPLIEELFQVLSRPRLVKKYQLDPMEIAEYIVLLEEKSIKVNPKGEFHLCRDLQDDIILETAILGKVKYMITRDDDIKRDLLLIKHMQKHGINILTVNQFINTLKDSR